MVRSTNLFMPSLDTELVIEDQKITGFRFVVVSSTKADGVELGQRSNNCVAFVVITESVGDANGVIVTMTESVLFAGVVSAWVELAIAVLVTLPASVPLRP